MRSHKKPLGKSIALGCIVSIAILCLVLGVMNYINYRNALYKHYESYISDILRYVDRHIDDEDLKHCIETKQESEKYKETLRFMDGIMDDFSIHYLYAIKPLNLNKTGNVMSVLSAEDYYNRYVDTEGNLYLGWISDDEFDADLVQKFFDIMEQDNIMFFVQRTEWGTDYTGALPLKGEDGEAYAILAVDVDITTLSGELRNQVLQNAGLILLLGILYTVIFLGWTRTNVTEPIMSLEKGVVEYAERSKGQHSVEALKFEAPDIHTENEVESLSEAITTMTVSMQQYVSEMLSAKEESKDMRLLADTMSELAVIDNLTGVWNKTGYSREVDMIEQGLEKNKDQQFAVAMIDLNYLKVFNDTYGHEKGDDALKTLARIICTVFARSQVFRIGGDEFAVIIRGYDLEHCEELKDKFLSMIIDHVSDHPEKEVSAAIGIAYYDPDRDTCVDDVLKRADKEMYDMKKSMKAGR